MRSRSKTLWTLAITSVALFMVTLDNLVVTTALPVIRRDLHATLQGLEWTVNAYTLTFAVLLLTGAALGDRFGRRRLFVLGMAIFTGGSVAAALAPTIDALIAARALQGVGGAIVTPLTLTLLSAAVPAEERGRGVAPWVRGRAGGVRRRGAARSGSDAADALLPQPHVHADERVVAVHVLRDVRGDLPARAVLPDRAGLLAARLRPADPAVDGDADLHRPDR